MRHGEVQHAARWSSPRRRQLARTGWVFRSRSHRGVAMRSDAAIRGISMCLRLQAITVVCASGAPTLLLPTQRRQTHLAIQEVVHRPTTRGAQSGDNRNGRSTLHLPHWNGRLPEASRRVQCHSRIGTGLCTFRARWLPSRSSWLLCLSRTLRWSRPQA